MLESNSTTIDIEIYDAAVAVDKDKMGKLLDANRENKAEIESAISGLINSGEYEAVDFLNEMIKKSNISEENRTELSAIISREISSSIYYLAKNKNSRDLINIYKSGRFVELSNRIRSFMDDGEVDDAEFIAYIDHDKFKPIYLNAYENLYSPIRKAINEKNSGQLEVYFSENFARVSVVIRELFEENQFEALGWIKENINLKEVLSSLNLARISKLANKTLYRLAIEGKDKKILEMLDNYGLDTPDIILVIQDLIKSGNHQAVRCIEAVIQENYSSSAEKVLDSAKEATRLAIYWAAIEAGEGNAEKLIQAYEAKRVDEIIDAIEKIIAEQGTMDCEIAAIKSLISLDFCSGLDARSKFKEAAIRAYASLGKEQEVNDLLLSGNCSVFQFDAAVNGYKAGGHQEKSNDLLFVVEYFDFKTLRVNTKELFKAIFMQPTAKDIYKKLIESLDTTTLLGSMFSDEQDVLKVAFKCFNREYPHLDKDKLLDEILNLKPEVGTPMLEAALKPNTLLGFIFEFNGISSNDSFQDTIERKHKILRELDRRNPDKNYSGLYVGITKRHDLLFGAAKNHSQVNSNADKDSNFQKKTYNQESYLMT